MLEKRKFSQTIRSRKELIKVKIRIKSKEGEKDV
jgi:hypothetical protein